MDVVEARTRRTGWTEPELPKPRRSPPRAAVINWQTAVVAAVVAVGVALRFFARSDLWLDEALTVNVARLPLARLPEALRHDGAPPLYYVLLHVWMRLFGTGDAAVRSLSSICAVASLPFAWMAGRRVGGRAAGRALGLELTLVSSLAVGVNWTNWEGTRRVHLPLAVAIPLGLAMLVNENMPGRTLFRSAFVAPLMISASSVGVLWQWFYNPAFGFRNAAIFNILAKAQREKNLAKRIALYKQANILIMKYLPAVPYAHSRPALGFEKTVKGYVPSPVGTDPFEGVSIGGQ